MTMVSIDVTTDSFEHDVLEASLERPVLVDFWAPWCAPCRSLKPVLEKLAAEYSGRFRLAKINTDEHPEIASRFGVRGIPNVKAFVDGRVADEFTGALPESGVRRFVEALLPSPSEKMRRSAAAAIAQGDFDAAEPILREAIALDDQNAAARIDLGELLVARRDYEGAEAVLAPIPTFERDERLERLRAAIESWRNTRDLPPAEELRTRVERDPADLDARMQLGERRMADGSYEEALEAFLEVVTRDRGDMREAARRAMVRVFSLAANQPDLVRRYRQRLSAALN